MYDRVVKCRLLKCTFTEAWNSFGKYGNAYLKLRPQSGRTSQVLITTGTVALWLSLGQYELRYWLLKHVYTSVAFIYMYKKEISRSISNRSLSDIV